MPDDDPAQPNAPGARLRAELPRICRPARAAEDAWHFAPALSSSLGPAVQHDGLALLWRADDRRSFHVLTATEAAPAPGERRQRTAIDASALRSVFRGETWSLVDSDAEPGFGVDCDFERAERARGTRAWAAAPMPDAGETAGVLVVTRRSPTAFTAAELRLLGEIAADLVPFVAGALLLAQLAERERRRRAFEALHHALAGSLDVRKVFDGIVDAVRPVFGFDVMGVELMQGNGRTSARIVEGGDAALWPASRDVDDYSWNQRLDSGDPLLLHDLRVEGDAGRRGDRQLQTAGVRSCLLMPLALPLSRQEQAQGLIYLAARRPYWFDTVDVETLRGLADPITLAIHHHRRVQQKERRTEAEERTKELQQRLQAFRHEHAARYGFDRILGRSAAVRDLLGRAAKVAPTATTVLITGESGTGKELVAHAIHLGSARAAGPFLALNCAALPEALLESELFGHEKGAFTGAAQRKPGRFELAAGGTLFLDEVGELLPAVQAKLLRVLQEREFQPVGGTKTVQADVRLIAATNRDLAAEVAAGRFREDLLYRLNVFALHLPPLRERGDDVLILAEHFVAELEAGMGKSVPGISQEARHALLDYPWPGNIRELQNAIERAMILSDGGLIQSTQLGLDAAKIAAAKAAAGARAPADTAAGDAGALGSGQRLAEWERRLVVEALQKAGGNKSRAAELLGVTRSQLYTRMKRFGL